jgi:hypothetical protein
MLGMTVSETTSGAAVVGQGRVDSLHPHLISGIASHCEGNALYASFASFELPRGHPTSHAPNRRQVNCIVLQVWRPPQRCANAGKILGDFVKTNHSGRSVAESPVQDCQTALVSEFQISRSTTCACYTNVTFHVCHLTQGYTVAAVSLIDECYNLTDRMAMTAGSKVCNL